MFEFRTWRSEFRSRRSEIPTSKSEFRTSVPEVRTWGLRGDFARQRQIGRNNQSINLASTHCKSKLEARVLILRSAPCASREPFPIGPMASSDFDLDLDDLDLPEVGGATEGHPGQSKIEAKDEHSPPRASSGIKRLSSASSLGSGSAKKRGRKQATDIALGVKEEEEGGTEEATEKQVACIGCCRPQNSNGCYVHVGQRVQWAWPDGRGKLCLDCHCCWRTMYSKGVHLGSFSSWLKDPANRADFEKHLLGYMALLNNGCKKLPAL